MLFFMNDYGLGAHPKLLERLAAANLEPLGGYGSDRYTKSAAEKIKAACDAPGAEVRFLGGGTQTNRLVISALLHPSEGVIAAATGHVAVHEAGAIEASGHKVLTLPPADGKLTAEAVERCLAEFHADPVHEHMVWPGMVYLSWPSEYGTLYSRAELEAIHAVCRRYDIPLYLDGARLGYGLAASEDVTLPDLARLCDVFYIGGTKVGALCGEALVFPQGAPKRFLTLTKQQGALFAKGRLIGIQFDALFTDGLYLELGRHGVAMARQLRSILLEKGYPLLIDSPTNQLFPILTKGTAAELEARDVVFEFWEPVDAGRIAVRFACSWGTPPEDVAALGALL